MCFESPVIKPPTELKSFFLTFNRNKFGAKVLSLIGPIVFCSQCTLPGGRQHSPVKKTGVLVGNF